MNSDIRNRIVLPVLLPIVVIGGVAAVVGGLAFVFLYTTRVLALTIALVVSAGIMVAISLASSIDEQDMTIGRRGVILMTGVLPLVGGLAVALWSINGGVPEEELNINREPVLSAPEGAVVGAVNEQNFCVFPEGEEESQDNCEDTSEVTFPAQPDGAPFLFLFNNLQSNIQHNFQIFQLAGDAADASPGESIFGTQNGAATITGPAETLYNVPADAPLTPGQYYYNCVVHPAMEGVLTIAEGEGGDGASDGDGGEG